MNLAFSLRRRLVLAFVLALSLAGLVTSELYRMIRSSADQRLQFTRSLVAQELEHVAVESEAERSTLTGLRSGIVRGDSVAVIDRALPGEVDTVLRAQASGLSVDQRRSVEVPVADKSEGPRREVNAYFLGVLGRADGSVAWVAYPVRTPPFADRFRSLLVALGALVLLLAALTLFTVGSVDRGVRSLTSSLRALDENLDAEVARPRLAELRRVADGIRALAKSLALETAERETLAGELQRRERLAALGRVVAGVAHEVRNPLASLKLKIDLAKSDASATVTQRAELVGMGREVERLDRLVSDLLVLGGRRPRSRCELDLQELVRERASLLAPWAEARGVTVRTGDDVGPLLRSIDRDGFSQAIDNLLRNAVEAAPRGAAVDIAARVAGSKVRVEIEDPGPGVADERTAQLFEPFFTTKAEGLGLGLATARAIAVAEGGDLRYAREHGKTRFTLEV